ncbi:MAG TPA: MFS transporter [Candidatus Acidoferrales bacterium]|nr:MFS transporter [Candidatus Acidoferrales bacterium]
MSEQESHSKVRAVIRVSSGNFLEMYDFMVYAYYASYIAHEIFPSSSAYASLMMTLGTFGAGYLMRPLGAVVLGAYIDRHGRRAGLILTLFLMAIGTLVIACTPPFRTIGIVAPLVVVLGRLLQGFSAGVEVGGASVYLSEMATPGNRGFYCAWQSASQQVAVIFAALLGVALSAVVSPEGMAQWGWRVPFYIGCLIVPLLFWLRRSLAETQVFLAQKRHPQISEILASLATNWKIVGVGVLLSTMTTVCFYLITAYTPTYGREVLHLTNRESLVVTLCVGFSNFFWLPMGGIISDRIGRRPLLILITVAAITTSYPAMLWLASDPSTTRLLLVELWLSVFFGVYNGAMIPHLAEIMPPEIRTSGFSLAFSLATAIFGGFTPAICTYLIHESGNRAMPALWLSFAAACGLVAALFGGRQRAVLTELEASVSPQ